MAVELDDTELLALVLLCVIQLSRTGCKADPAITSAMTKLTAERVKRGSRPLSISDFVADGGA